MEVLMLSGEIERREREYFVENLSSVIVFSFHRRHTAPCSTDECKMYCIMMSLSLLFSCVSVARMQ